MKGKNCYMLVKWLVQMKPLSCIQLWTFAYIRLLNKPYENEVTLREQKIPLQCCQSLDFLYVFKRFRSFIAINIKSVGQRALKLLAVKVWKWFDPRRSWIWAELFKWGLGVLADFFLSPPAFTASNFEALWPTDPISLA